MTDITDQTTRDRDAPLWSRLARRMQANWRVIITIIPFAWLFLFFLFPFFIVAKISLAEVIIASPPFSRMIEWTDGGIVTIRLVFDNFTYILTDNLYFDTYVNSLKISVTSTIICLLFGYPIAYGIVRSGPVAKPILLFTIILPFWTSFLLRGLCVDGPFGGSGNDQQPANITGADR